MLSRLKKTRAKPASKAAAGDARSRRRWFWPLYATYLVLAVATILIGIELVLWCAFLITGYAHLQTLSPGRDPASYPEDAPSYVKIAVFGGSAAEGAYSPRSFTQMIQHELRMRFPTRKLYVKNYAASGYPFHRHQAELVKMLMDKYDILLIYCGNNEASNWYDDSGFWRVAERKGSKELVFRSPPEASPDVVQHFTDALQQHSRIYALASHLGQLMRQAQQPLQWNVNPDFAEFEEAPALPDGERERLTDNFQRDLKEICQLADRYDKQILLATSATHQTWPPCYSYFGPGLTEADQERWRQEYDAGLAAWKMEDAQQALVRFMNARAIDPKVAILNHRIGLCYRRLGRFDDAQPFLCAAIDQDGFYMRSISDLHETAQAMAERCQRLHYVDAVEACNRALLAGVTDDDLFVDICHPSFLGHAVIARAFLQTLLRLEPFSSWTRDSQGAEWPAGDWPDGGASYARQMGVTDQQRALATMNSILWYFELAHFTAYRQRCYEQILQKIEQLEREFSDSQGKFRAVALASRARLEIIQGDYDTARQRINQAFDLSPEAVRGMLNLDAWNHPISEEFEDVGIVFSRHDSAFIQQ